MNYNRKIPATKKSTEYDLNIEPDEVILKELRKSLE